MPYDHYKLIALDPQLEMLRLIVKYPPKSSPTVFHIIIRVNQGFGFLQFWVGFDVHHKESVKFGK